MKRAILALLMVATLATVGAAQQGPSTVRSYQIFSGANTDSNEVKSRWVPIRGASRIYIRLWTTHAAFVAGSPDSAFSDSVITFKVNYADTVNTVSGVSRGAVAAVDTIEVDPATLTTANLVYVDTTVTEAIYRPLPINKPLRLTGQWTRIAPVEHVVSVNYSGHLGVFSRQYISIKVQPLKRLKDTSTPCAGACNPTGRVNGLKGLRGEMIVYYQ